MCVAVLISCSPSKNGQGMHDYPHTSVGTDTDQGRMQTSLAEHTEGHQKNVFGSPFCLPLPAEGLKQTHNLLGSVWKPVGGNDCSSDFN